MPLHSLRPRLSGAQSESWNAGPVVMMSGILPPTSVLRVLASFHRVLPLSPHSTPRPHSAHTVSAADSTPFCRCPLASPAVSAGVLPRFCRASAVRLPFCRWSAGGLPLFIRDSAAGDRQKKTFFLALPRFFPRYAASTPAHHRLDRPRGHAPLPANEGGRQTQHVVMHRWMWTDAVGGLDEAGARCGAENGKNGVLEAAPALLFPRGCAGAPLGSSPASPMPAAASRRSHRILWWARQGRWFEAVRRSRASDGATWPSRGAATGAPLSAVRSLIFFPFPSRGTAVVRCTCERP